MAKYRTKPVVVDAFQLGHDFMPTWFLDKLRANEITTHNLVGRPEGGPACALIKTAEGQLRAEHGDYIIRGVKGEIYPCKPDIFKATYDYDVEMSATVAEEFEVCHHGTNLDLDCMDCIGEVEDAARAVR